MRLQTRALFAAVTWGAASVSHCGARVVDAVDRVEPAANSTATPTPDFIWYVLDETHGTTAKDSSPHHYDIRNLGVTWSQGANLDGVSGCGSTTVDPSYRDPPITISAWLTPRARADETSNQYGLVPYPSNAIGNDEPGAFGYGLGLNVWTDGTGGSALSAEDVDTCQIAATPPPYLCVANENAGDAGPFLAGHEYFVATTIGLPAGDASTLAARVYVNGALFDETTAANPGNVPQTTLYLGCHNADMAYGTKRVFAGRIRDARVYKRELGATEVAQLFGNGPATAARASSTAGAASDGSSE
jgi:concanavalin A-like lectin/glucanase superfamily protein